MPILSGDHLLGHPMNMFQNNNTTLPKYWNENLWKYEIEMLKMIIIILGYTLNNFTTHITIS